MKPIGVILIGGMDSNYRDISNVEVLGLENCSVPELPEWRYNHGSFITWWGALAVCGGQYNSRPTSSDCLVLNTTTKQWEHGVLNNLLGSKVVGVASIGVGTYIVHTATISFLPTDELRWIAGPSPPDFVECAAKVSEESFFIFTTNTSVRQFDSSTEDWSADGTWPNLQVQRFGPGCATLGDKSIVAGGRNLRNDLLKSVEIIFLNSKTLGKGEDMQRPREIFNLVAVGNTLMALGGYNNDTSIEVWEETVERWREASMSLVLSRMSFSAVAITDDSICLDDPLPPHSCPTVDGDECVFPFTNGRLSNIQNLCHP